MENFTQSDNITIIIPARYASTRLEGKPLLRAKGKTIIQWVYEKATQSKLASDVIVATDDKRIFDEVESFGGKACMTATTHKCGSDRLVEVLKKYENIEIAVNVQGDEPMIEPESIDSAIKVLIEDKNADISTLIRKIDDEDEIQNPNVVKAVTDNNGYAMYFSRSPIPYERNKNIASTFAHIGLYVYRREALLKMSELPQSVLEKAESLEQLRALQNGMKIKTATVNYKPVGIDTKEDFEEFLKKVI
ncbi:MAG: 3-deoxy-manno-octulosonate cytidylyltransferase [Candidatus Gastranaerophilales bacterium]|nr:3-deoxy-manno-octulosonate cytidylyltransferase [Candidatus Gastranaerophilales bacterium]